MLKFFAGAAGGLLLAFLGSLLFNLMTAASSPVGFQYVFVALWFVGVTVAMTAETATEAWRKLLLGSSVLCFLAPIAGIVFTGNMISTHGESTGLTAGLAIGGGLVSGFLGFVGFFFGVVLLIIGLLVGREKQVVYVERTQPERPNSDVVAE